MEYKINIGDKVVFRYPIARNLELVCNSQATFHSRDVQFNIVKFEGTRSLLVLSAWLEAKPKHVYKYAAFYLDKGFDILIAFMPRSHLFFPKSGYMVTAANIADFLHEVNGFQYILFHQFSLGGSVSGLTFETMMKKREIYHHIITKLKGRIFDSPAYAHMASKGLSHLLFPENRILRFIAEKFWGAIFYLTSNYVMKYHIETNAQFWYPSLKLPTLVLFSKDDPISPFSDNMKTIKIWKAQGIKVQYKYWENSQHVTHLQHHREEYLEQINLFLSSIGVHNQNENNN